MVKFANTKIRFFELILLCPLRGCGGSLWLINVQLEVAYNDLKLSFLSVPDEF
jgi:hypothetical protein